FEYNIIRKNGENRFIEVSVDSIYDDDGKKNGCRGVIRDKTDKKKSMENLIKVEQRFKRLFNNALVGMITTDIKTSEVIDSNELCHKMFGYDNKNDFIGNVCMKDLYYNEFDRVEIIQEMNETGKVCNREVQFRKRDGSIFWAEVLATMYPEEGKIEGIIIDITKRKVAEETVLDLTFFDRLTQLPNKEMFSNLINTEIMRARKIKDNYLFAVMCLGIDQFKKINNMYGSGVGNSILKEVARRLEDTIIKKEDKVARFDGDKFLILFSNIKSIDDAAIIVNNIYKIFTRSFAIDEHKIKITSSSGICLYPKDGDNSEILINNSEVAMYIAKGIGRNIYHFFDAHLNDKMLKRFQLEKDMHKALINEKFIPYFQTKVDQNGSLLGMESLIRWQTDESGIILPLQFIPLAEENGMIVDIGYYMLKKSCEQNKLWQDKGYDPIKVSVNLSPYQFNQEDIIDRIEEITKMAGLDPKWLELEITESGILKNEYESIKKLQRLRDKGFSIAIDDFGTGYSSLSKLQDLPIDTIKIDRSFIEKILTNPKTAAIARYIIKLGHDLGYKVVAEGVEQKEQVDYLKDLGCDQFQGFYFSKPLPSELFEDSVF
ncbi:EAL domain-containing protein, partial [Spirochaetota bacterium]